MQFEDSVSDVTRCIFFLNIPTYRPFFVWLLLQTKIFLSMASFSNFQQQNRPTFSNFHWKLFGNTDYKTH